MVAWKTDPGSTMNSPNMPLMVPMGPWLGAFRVLEYATIPSVRAWGALWIVVFAGSISSSCHLRRRTDPKPAEQRARGEALYVANCALCHGGYGYENRAPDLRRSAVLNRDVNGNLVGAVARAGRPALGMPSFANLTNAQIADLAAFLHFAGRTIQYGPTTDRMLTGDPVQGRAYFAAACSGCHSPTGDLAGIATRLSALDLQNRLVFPVNAATPSATVILPDGRRIEGLVVHDDEFSISITGRDGWYHSWPRTGVRVEIHDRLAGHLALMERLTNRDMHNVFAYLATLK
jgi:cytochrome c oxidase cbb3-type subunit III